MKQLILVTCIAALVACGKGDKGDKGGGDEELKFQSACDTREANKICIEYFGLGASKDHCAQMGGKAVDRCPTADALGRCKSKTLGIQQTLFYPPTTKETAEQLCKAMADDATFVAP